MKLTKWKVVWLVVAMGGSMAWAQTEISTNSVPPRKAGRPSRDEMMKRFDTDGDGVLSDAEKAAMREAMRKERPAPPPMREEMLKRFDTNGDGQLSENERAAMQEKMREERGGPPRGERGASHDEILKRFDADGDGVLSDAERKTMREKLKAERQEAPPAGTPAE